MLPELVSKREYSGQDADLWATGVVMYTMLTGFLPFRGRDEKDLYRKIQKGQYATPCNERGAMLSQEATSLIK
jgi:serine/threonine protein kinase